MSSSHEKRGRHTFIGARLGLLSLKALRLVANISRIKTYYLWGYAARAVFHLNVPANFLVTPYLLSSFVYLSTSSAILYRILSPLRGAKTLDSF